MVGLIADIRHGLKVYLQDVFLQALVETNGFRSSYTQKRMEAFTLFDKRHICPLRALLTSMCIVPLLAWKFWEK